MGVVLLILTTLAIVLGVMLSGQKSSSNGSMIGVMPTADQVAKCLIDGRQYTPFKTKCTQSNQLNYLSSIFRVV
jgi:hypothetical protein